MKVHIGRLEALPIFDVTTRRLVRQTGPAGFSISAHRGLKRIPGGPRGIRRENGRLNRAGGALVPYGRSRKSRLEPYGRDVIHVWKRMYELALRLLHHPVVIQHISGLVYHGILIRVTKKGMYLIPFGEPVPATGLPGVDARTADLGPNATGTPPVDAQPVVFAPLFFPFAVVASFAAGTLLGAAASRPPYPYPYYPPYGGYPYGW